MNVYIFKCFVKQLQMLCACAAWNPKNVSSSWNFVNLSWNFVNLSWNFCFDILHASARIFVKRVQICDASIQLYVECFSL